MALLIFCIKGDLVQEKKENIEIKPNAILIKHKDIITIGRGSDSDIKTTAAAVSRKHCTLIKRGQGWVITDQNSRGGTYIDRGNKFAIRLISGEFPLEKGDYILLGGLIQDNGVLVLSFGGE